MLLYKRMLFFIAKITTKTDEKAVFFESFQGRSFACSPKAMYLQMQQDDKYKDFSFFWGLRKTDREDFSNKKNNMKELIVNSVLCIIDVALVTIGLIMIFGF